MAFDLVSPTFWNMSSRVPSLFSDDSEELQSFSQPSGVSISEDDKSVFITAALPGVDEKDVDITFDKGILWIKGETKEEEEDKKKKFYRRSTGSFSYRISVPGDLDMSKEPDAKYSNGVMKISFSKSPQSQPRKITIKNSK